MNDAILRTVTDIKLDCTDRCLLHMLSSSDIKFN